MKNKKGFSMIELLVAFVIMAFLLGIGVVSYRFIIDRVASSYYDTLEEELLLAGSDYFTNHREDKPLSGYSAVYIDELVGDKYIETLKDRNGKVCSASNDSKVYIYKTEKGYGYEACLVCNDYKSEGTYCDGVALGVINISAVKEDGTSYNPLLSYENNSWSNSDVTVTFGVNVPVTKFVITNTKNGTRSECTNINDKSCSMIFNETSTYNVKAYNEGIEVAPETGFNIKIDKEAPVITYNLDAGTYDETKDVTLIVTDNCKIDLVTYELYKDDILSSSGIPTIASLTNINFDVKLDDYGTWKLEVTATDNAGNKTSDTRSFVIRKSQSCGYKLDNYFDTETCGASGTFGEGDEYVTCTKVYRFNVMYAPQSTSTGTLISQSCYLSQYDYDSEDSAKTACKNNYQSTYSSPCFSHYQVTNDDGSRKYMFNCVITSIYRNYVYKYVCE